MRAQINGTSTADFSATATKKVTVTDLEHFLAFCDEQGLLSLYVDPEAAGAVNTTPEKSREHVNDAFVRYVEGAPVLAGAAAGINDRQVFNWSAEATSDTVVDRAGLPASWTFMTVVVPATTSVDGTATAFLMEAHDGAQRHFLVSVADATPQLALSVGGQVLYWEIDAALAPGVPVLVAVTVNEATSRAALYVGDPTEAKVEATLGTPPAAYADARLHLAGSVVATSQGWRGKMGKALLFEGDLTAINDAAFFAEAWRLMASHYGL